MAKLDHAQRHESGRLDSVSRSDRAGDSPPSHATSRWVFDLAVDHATRGARRRLFLALAGLALLALAVLSAELILL